MLDVVQAPGLIKVDTEGAEVEIIAGTRKLLETVRPNWIIEVGGQYRSNLANEMLGRLFKLRSGDFRISSTRKP